MIHWFSVGFVTNYHNLSGLSQQKFILLQSCKQELLNLAGPPSFWGSRERIPSWPLPASGGCSVPGLPGCVHTPLPCLPLSAHCLFLSMCLIFCLQFLSAFLSYGHWSQDLEPTLIIQDYLHFKFLKHIWKTPFKIRWTITNYKDLMCMSFVGKYCSVNMTWSLNQVNILRPRFLQLIRIYSLHVP